MNVILELELKIIKYYLDSAILFIYIKKTTPTRFNYTRRFREIVKKTSKFLIRDTKIIFYHNVLKLYKSQKNNAKIL